ncbi:MAG: hypothetical protein ACLP8Y_02820 [Thermoplasmata archaeon]
MVVVLALFASGVLTTKGGGGGAIQGESSASALAVANAYAKTFPGGPWNISGLAGLHLTTAHTLSLLGSGSLSTCAMEGTQNYTVSASSGNYSSGNFPVWEVDYFNASGTLNLLVVGSQVVAHLLEVGPGHCTSLRLGPTLLNTSGISSVAAAPAALSYNNLSGFAAAHSQADAQAVLRGGEWWFTYTSCDLFYDTGAPAAGAAAEAGVSTATGRLDPNATYFDAMTVCALRYWYGQEIPPSSLFAVGNPMGGTCPMGFTFATDGCLAGDYTYWLTIETSYLDFVGVQLSVDTSTGATYNLPAASPGGFSILNPEEEVAAQSPIAGSHPMQSYGFTVWNSGVSPTDLLPTNDTILIDMGTLNPTGMGLTFVVGCPLFPPGQTTPPLSLP